MDDHNYSRESSDYELKKVQVSSNTSLDINIKLEAGDDQVQNEDDQHNLENDRSFESNCGDQIVDNANESSQDEPVLSYPPDSAEFHDEEALEQSNVEELISPPVKYEDASQEISDENASQDVHYDENVNQPENVEISGGSQLMEYIYQQDPQESPKNQDVMVMNNMVDYTINWQGSESQVVDDSNVADMREEETNELHIAEPTTEEYSISTNEDTIVFEQHMDAEDVRVEGTIKLVGAKIFKCTICHFETKQDSSLVDHFNEKHDIITKLYRCSHCGDETRKRLAIKKVINKRQRNPTVYRCRYCEYVSNEKSYLQAHINFRHNTDLFICTFCKYSTMILDELSKHFTLNHYYKNDTFHCSECNFEATTDLDLSNHYKVIHDIDIDLLKWSQQLIGVKCKCIANIENCQSEENREICMQNKIEIFRCYTCGKETRFKPYKPYVTLYSKSLNDAKLVKPPPKILKRPIPKLDTNQRVEVIKTVFTNMTTKSATNVPMQVVRKAVKEDKPKNTTVTNIKCYKCEFRPRDEDELVKHYQEEHIMVLNNTKTRPRTFEPKRRLSTSNKAEPPYLKKQLNEKDIEGRFKCPRCNFRTQFKPHLTNHLQHCKPIKKYSCGKCIYFSGFAEEVMEHVRNVHGAEVRLTGDDLKRATSQNIENMKAVESITCGTEEDLNESVENMVQEVSCMQCSFKTFDEAALMTHIRLKHVLSFKLQKNTSDFQIAN